MSYYPPGNYRGTIIAQAMSESKEKKTPCFVLRFTVDEPLGAALPPMERYEREMQLYITDGTLPFFLEKLQRLGFYGQSFSQLDPQTDGHHSFVGQEIEAYCKHENKDDGSTWEKWDLSRGNGSIDSVPLSPKSLRDLDNKYGAQLKKLFGKNPQPLDAANAKVEKDFDAYSEKIDTALAKGREATAAATADSEIPF